MNYTHFLLLYVFICTTLSIQAMNNKYKAVTRKEYSALYKSFDEIHQQHHEIVEGLKNIVDPQVKDRVCMLQKKASLLEKEMQLLLHQLQNVSIAEDE